MKIFWGFLITILLTYVGLCVLLYVRQEALIFYPTVLPQEHQYSFRTRFEELALPIEGAVINVVHFKAEKPKGVVFYLHGNGDIINFLGATSEQFTQLGYDVFIPDYRGYGKSTGEIKDEATFYDDMAKVYSYLAQHFPELPIIIYGHSIGSGLAVRLAAENQPQQLILESPYYSLSSLIAEKMPWIPTSLLLKYQLRSDQYIADVRSPILLIHGTDDSLIPFENSRRLLERIQTQKQLVTVQGGGHGNLRDRREWQETIEAVLQ